MNIHPGKTKDDGKLGGSGDEEGYMFLVEGTDL